MVSRGDICSKWQRYCECDALCHLHETACRRCGSTVRMGRVRPGAR